MKASTVSGNTLAVTVVVPVVVPVVVSPSSLIESSDSDSVSFGGSSFETMLTVLARADVARRRACPPR